MTAANTNIPPVVFHRSLSYSDGSVYAVVQRRSGSDIVSIRSDDNLICVPVSDLEGFINSLRQGAR